MASWSPGRPPNARDVELTANGRVTFLGVIVSAGTAVDNATTANPFAQTPLGPIDATGTATPTRNLTNTLAGRFLLVEATAAGHVLAAALPLNNVPSPPIVTTLASATPAVGTSPGPTLQANERVPFIMGAQDGWLQFIPTSGSANLFVWELT